MFLNQLGNDEEIIDFNDNLNNTPQSSPKRSPTKRNTQLKLPSDTMGNPSVRVVKNETFIKNLGNNEATYAEKKVDLAKIKIEEPEQEQMNQPEFIKNDEDCESIIQFQDLAERESQVRSMQKIDDSDIFSAQIENNSQSPSKLSKSPSKIIREFDLKQDNGNEQNFNQSVLQNQSIYPLKNQEVIFQKTIQFLSQPIQQDGIIQCEIEVNTSGLNVFKNKFYLKKDQVIYLAAKKTSNTYVISMNNQNIQKYKEGYIGKIKCKNINNYEFYDSGFNQKKKKLPVQQLLGTVQFDLPAKPTQPRQQIVIYYLNQVKLFGSEQQYINRMPKWNVKTQSFTLNFHNRSKKSSIKNFQLIQQNEVPEKLYIQLGKENDHLFNLDFHSPFSPLMAFMIALANYDKKIQY